MVEPPPSATTIASTRAPSSPQHSGVTASLLVSAAPRPACMPRPAWGHTGPHTQRRGHCSPPICLSPPPSSTHSPSPPLRGARTKPFTGSSPSVLRRLRAGSTPRPAAHTKRAAGQRRARMLAGPKQSAAEGHVQRAMRSKEGAPSGSAGMAGAVLPSMPLLPSMPTAADLQRGPPCSRPLGTPALLPTGSNTNIVAFCAMERRRLTAVAHEAPALQGGVPQVGWQVLQVRRRRRSAGGRQRLVVLEQVEVCRAGRRQWR